MVAGFRILTWNLWIAPLVRLNPAQNLPDIANFIQSQDADVICLQEVGNT